MSSPPDAMLKAAFDAVNKLRARYGVQALKWDARLYSDAYHYAQTLANKDAGLVHASNVCENLDMIFGDKTPYDKVGVEAVRRMWAERPELKSYGPAMAKGEEWMYFNDGSKGYNDWGHFANLVGKGHHSMGMSAMQTPNALKFAPNTGRGWYVVLRLEGDFSLGSGKQFHTMPAKTAYMMQPGQPFPSDGSENNAGEGVVTGPPLLEHDGCDHFIDCEPGSTLRATHHTGGVGYQLTKIIPIKVAGFTINTESTTVMDDGWSVFAGANHCHCAAEGKGCEIPRKQIKLPSPQHAEYGSLTTYTPVGDDGYESVWEYRWSSISTNVRTTTTAGWAAMMRKYQLCCIK